MKNVVKLKKSQLDYFRKLARQSSLEIMAYLIGEVRSPELTVIHSFAYTQAYDIQTDSTVGWSSVEYARVAKQAEELGKRIVGHIHTHPRWDAVMSEVDYEGCISEGFRICGIVSVYDRKTRVRFWSMDSALPCKVQYV